MSNTSGTAPGEPGPSVDAAGAPPTQDADPVTEVIRIPAASLSTHHDERRYTAPGFDAGSTQIIDRVPDAGTGFTATPTGSFAAAPRAILPKSARRPARLIPILMVVAALAAAAILGLVLLQRSRAAAETNREAVRSTIRTFDAAVRTGDLTALREVTCGQAHEAYVAYEDRAFADAYARISAAKQYPVVAGIDEVVINGDHAEANVTAYMAFDPATTSTRSFDLQLRDGRWKICQSS